MSEDAVAGLRVQVQDVLDLTADLSEPEWEAPSACRGWSTKDVVAHLGSVFHGLVDPSELAGGSGRTVEDANEVPVGKRRSWPAAEVREEYEAYAPQAIARLQAFQGPDMRSAPFPLGELGTFQLHQLADALCFDHVVHVQWDLLAPSGPLARPRPPLQEVAMTPTIDWMLAGLPQMCRQDLGKVLTRPVRLHLEGPGGRSIDLLPPGGDGLVEVVPWSEDDAGEPAVVLSSGTYPFLAWATKRSDWRGEVTIVEGDRAYAASVLDAVNVV